jgi:hypothetical protein
MPEGHVHSRGFVHHHSLSISAIAILLLWIYLYIISDPSTHLGSFYGNAIADWPGRGRYSSCHEASVRTKFSRERAAAKEHLETGSGVSARLFARHLSAGYRNRMGDSLNRDGLQQQVGTSRPKRRIGMDADFRSGAVDQTHDGAPLEGESPTIYAALFVHAPKIAPITQSPTSG